MFTPEDETRGLAFIGHSLAFTLMQRLKARGVLTGEDTAWIIETCLEAVEHAPDSDSMRVARHLLDALAKVEAGSKPPG